MPKRGMEPIRQQQFIEATIRAIHEAGLHGTTLARVAKLAGTSTGLVAHYFSDKAGLLEATFRYLARELGHEFRRQLRNVHTPQARALAVIEANFAESQSRPEIVSAWLSFWANVNHEPRMARVQRVVASRLRTNLLVGLRELLPREDAVRVSTGLSVLIDGLWLRASLHTGGIDFHEARELARDYLITQLEAKGKEVVHDGAA